MSSSKKLTCKRTLRQVFIRVYRLEIATFLHTFSHVGIIFSTQLCDLYFPLLPLTFGSTPPFPVWICVLYTMCKEGGIWGSGPQTDKHLPQSPFTGLFSDLLHCLLSVLSFYDWRVWPPSSIINSSRTYPRQLEMKCTFPYLSSMNQISKKTPSPKCRLY
jgi:hypothetical protein